MKPQPIPILSTEEQIGGLAKTASFDVPENLREQFIWTAGQHITLCLKIQGEEVRRCYTISASPTSGDPLRITVKRVQGGLVSNYINDELEENQTIDLLPPSGDFQLTPGDTERRTHYFIGAGSGIPPSSPCCILSSLPNPTPKLTFYTPIEMTKALSFQTLSALSLNPIPTASPSPMFFPPLNFSPTFPSRVENSGWRRCPVPLFPLIEPDLWISHIRLSCKFHRKH